MKKAVTQIIEEITDFYNSVLVIPIINIFNAGFAYKKYNLLGKILVFPIQALLTIPIIIFFACFQVVFMTFTGFGLFIIDSIVWILNFIFGGKLFEINIVYVFKKLFYKNDSN